MLLIRLQLLCKYCKKVGMMESHLYELYVFCVTLQPNTVMCMYSTSRQRIRRKVKWYN